METYYIDFGTGAGNFEIKGTLEDAMKAAEKELAYTQLPVNIYKKGRIGSGMPDARLPWYGVEPEEDDIVTANFGYGFYGEWVVD